VAGLAHALQRLRDDPTLRQRLGQQARQLALAHLTAKAMTQRYEHLWEKVLDLPLSLL
jgi:glycosyltransferase involved in cell wall biosynthesis